VVAIVESYIKGFGVVRPISSSSPEYSPEQRRALLVSLSRSRFFILLGLSADFDGSTPARMICTCANPKVVIKLVQLVSQSGDWHNGYNNWRFCIELKGRQSPATRITGAKRIASAIEGLLALVHHTAGIEFRPYQIPKEFIKRGAVSVELLERLEEFTGREQFTEDIRSSAKSFFAIPNYALAQIFYLLPFALQNEDLFNACSFFRESCKEYNFMDGAVSSILHNPKEIPENEARRLEIENVVLQSFRAIEAIVGQPGKNEDRYRQRLKRWGMKHGERVGFRKRHLLGKRIRWLNEARDSAAAHGKRRRQKPFTMHEAMEAQNLAESVLHPAMWFEAESLGRLGDGPEVTFLLSEMLPLPDGKLWVTDKTIRGKSAIDLARTPRGLAKVMREHERLVREWSEAHDSLAVPLKSR
jgi:hypothetical protein